MRKRSHSAASVPADLQAEFAAIAVRASAAGRALDPLPVLEISARPRRGSRVLVASSGTAQAPRVVLAHDLVGLAPGERAWTIAHELAHVLHAQEGTRRGVPSGVLARASLTTGVLVTAVASVGCVLAAGFSAVFGGGGHVGGLFVAGLGGVGVLVLTILGLIRAEEAAADASAAVVFGQVLSVAGVQRLRRSEGVAARCLPTLARSHPHPAARRRAGLAAQVPRTAQPSR